MFTSLEFSSSALYKHLESKGKFVPCTALLALKKMSVPVPINVLFFKLNVPVLFTIPLDPLSDFTFLISHLECCL